MQKKIKKNSPYLKNQKLKTKVHLKPLLPYLVLLISFVLFGVSYNYICLKIQRSFTSTLKGLFIEVRNLEDPSFNKQDALNLKSEVLSEEKTNEIKNRAQQLWTQSNNLQTLEEGLLKSHIFEDLSISLSNNKHLYIFCQMPKALFQIKDLEYFFVSTSGIIFFDKETKKLPIFSSELFVNKLFASTFFANTADFGSELSKDFYPNKSHTNEMVINYLQKLEQNSFFKKHLKALLTLSKNLQTNNILYNEIYFEKDKGFSLKIEHEDKSLITVLLGFYGFDKKTQRLKKILNTRKNLEDLSKIDLDYKDKAFLLQKTL